MQPLPDATTDLPTLRRWFRRFVEVRDAEGAERCLVSALRGGADRRQAADLLFAAATDHRYLQTGHVVDFTNKALEALDHAGWEHAEPVLTSLVSGYASADRMEEANAWRHPVDLVAILEHAFGALPAALELGASRRGGWAGREALVPVLLGEDAQAIADALLVALREGATGEEVAGAVAYAAVLRIARFHTSNEFGDWNTALHTFTFANAIHQGLRRAPSPELLRGVFDAAMSVYLDRFLNVPAARLPDPDGTGGDPEGLLSELPGAARPAAAGERGGGTGRALPGGRRTAGAAARRARPGAPPGGPGLSHDPGGRGRLPAVRAAPRDAGRGARAGRGGALPGGARPDGAAQGQTYQIAHRLFRGEHLFEEAQR